MDRRKEPVAIWKEKDCIGNEVVDAMVIILRTTGCRWARQKGCLMCGYNEVSDPSIDQLDLEIQLSKAELQYDGEKMVKIYTSGSFLDDGEIPAGIREEILGQFPDARRILVESRPEFVSGSVLDSVSTDRLMVAIGLETSNDEYLKRCVRKGFTVGDYAKAARTLQERRIPLRTYLLLKPPFLSEREAVEDAKRSIRFASRCSESVSINPLNVQRGTLVERLWRRGDYRTPWLWSLVEVLRSQVADGARILSSPSGGGNPRGVHNCGECDSKILEAVNRFSFTQDSKEFDDMGCACREEWRTLMNVQDCMFTSVDIGRYFQAIPSLEEE